MVSDIVLLDELPGFIKDSGDAYWACIAGAAQKQEYLEAIREAGFTSVAVQEANSVAGEPVGDDLAVKQWIEKAAISQETLEGAAKSAKSIRSSAVRPHSPEGGLSEARVVSLEPERGGNLVRPDLQEHSTRIVHRVSSLQRCLMKKAG